MNDLDTWVTRLASELGVDPAAVDTSLLLDVARDAAHAVARPAAPLTTFLVGLAAGLSAAATRPRCGRRDQAPALVAGRRRSAADRLPA